jgi:hypothetical protein
VLESLKLVLKRDYKFDPEIRHMAFFGTCADCQK